MTQRKADLLIATISMAWGSSYLLMKLGLNGIGPFDLIALRFGIAFVITFIIFFKRVRKVDSKIIGYNAVLGLILFSVFTALMYGLKTTTVSSAGFLTSTTVIFVPILQSLITRKMPTM
jgi:drug/metabolite transporter (DMT)-like permease